MRSPIIDFNNTSLSLHDIVSASRTVGVAQQDAGARRRRTRRGAERTRMDARWEGGGKEGAQMSLQAGSPAAPYAVSVPDTP
eukprot:1858705-Rhodomonas_salina.2